jgi:hypothetical protein
MVTVSDVKAYVFPLAHDWLEDSSPSPWKVPPVGAVHQDTAVRVSVVPPFVHADVGAVIETTPPDGVPQVTDCRVVDPAETFAVPADPGSPTWSCTYDVPVGKAVLAAEVASP